MRNIVAIKKTIAALTLFCAMCFAQKPQSSTNDYTKCLEKYKVPSEQLASGQAKCLQEYQAQSTKTTGEYTKCQEASGYTKCTQEYQAQSTKAVGDYTKCQEASGYTKCVQEYQASLTQNQTTSGSAECIEEYKAQLAQGIKTAGNDYTKCMGVVQSVIAEANKITMSDYNKCLEASGYTKCQQDYQTKMSKLPSNLTKCQEASGYTKCVQKYQQALTTKLPSDYNKCLEKYKSLSEKVTSGQSQCLQEYQAQQAKINTEAYTDTDTDTFIDLRDGKTYKIMKIGTQIWMAENLNYEAKGSKCYNNKPTYCTKYGRLYDWNVALKVCPEGWHLPTLKEWQTIVDFDTFGFAVLGGGYMQDMFPGDVPGQINEYSFSYIDLWGNWWSSSEMRAHSEDAFAWMANSSKDADYGNLSKVSLLSVRCLRDKE